MTPPEHEREPEEVFAAYVERLNAGEELDPERILAENPVFGADIIEYLEGYVGFASPPNGSNGPLGTLGDYVLRRQIGRGGMGVVYEAWQNSLDRRVALKVLPAGIAADDKAFHRFMREAKTAARLQHQNVVSVYGMGVESNTPYYSMEFVDGKTLAQVLVKLKEAEAETETPFGRKDDIAYFGNLARAFADVADGLQHAHSKGVVHRDIKPSNLILDSAGHLRILDFGLARLEGQESLTVSGDLMGTVLYMSPEQAMAKRIPLDHRTDVYSFGATMYEALTGEPPFRGKDQHDILSRIILRDPRPPRQLNPRVPKDLETIVLKCLRKDPANRYGTAEALSQDLRRFLRGDQIEARPQSALERACARLRRHRAKLAVVAVILALVCAIMWLGYRSELAEKRIEAARYAPAVLEVLKRIYAGRYSLQAVEGDLDGLFFKTSGRSLARMTPEEIKALWSDPDNHPVDEAARELARIAEVVAKPDGHYHLAKAYFLLGRRDDARSEVDKALEHDPDFVPAKILALDLVASGEDDSHFEALGWEFTRAHDWTNSWLEAQRSTGEKDWQRAAAAYGELIALGEQGREPYIGCTIEAYLGRGLARLALAEHRGAEGDFHAARTLAGPGLIEGVLLIGKARYLGGDAGEAEKTFISLYEGASVHEKNEAALWIAGVYYSVKDYEKGLRWAEQLGEEVPIRDRLRAYFLHRSGRTETAIIAARRAVRRSARDPVAHLVLASALHDGFFSAAPAAERVWKLFELTGVARTAVELDPESVSARRFLSVAESEWRVGYQLLRSKAMRHAGTWAVLWAAVQWAGVAGAQEGPEGFFDEPVMVLESPFGGSLTGPNVTPDGLTLFFQNTDFGAPTGSDILVVTRDRADESFLEAHIKAVEELNSSSNDHSPELSLDGLTIHFASNRPGFVGATDIFVATRETLDDPFGPPRNVKELNTRAQESRPTLTGDGLTIIIDRNAARRDLYIATRPSLDAPWETPRSLTEINTPLDQSWPSISNDGLTVFWSDFNPPFPDGNLGANDFWMATRASREEPFGNVRRVSPPISSPSAEYGPFISPDWPRSGAKIYFTRRGVDGIGDIYQSTWHPDCNGNRIDDAEEVDEGSLEDVNDNGVPDECEPVVRPLFRRGDCNADGDIDVADAVCILTWLFVAGDAPECVAATNTNADAGATVADASYLLNHLFAAGPGLAAPFPDCGVSDLEADAGLGCETGCR